MPSVDLSFSYHFLFIVAGFAVAFGVAFLSYRDPVPPQPRARRNLFIALRTLGAWLLMLLIGQPVVSLVERSLVPPVIDVLVDNSESLTLTDGRGNRRDFLRTALRSSEFSTIASEANVRWSLFDHSRHDVESWSPDSVRSDGDRSDIAGAFHDLRVSAAGRRPAAVILITDGNSTTPTNPLYEAQALGVPVFSIGVGDTSDPRDLRVSQVISNTTAYVGTRVPVNVVLHGSNMAGEQAEVRLVHRGRTVDRATVTLEAGSRDQRVTLSFIPDSSGLHRSTVSLSRLPGEITSVNNTATFLTRVLSDKLRVLLLSSAPNQDAAFLLRSLASDSNVTVTARTGTPQGAYLEGPLTPDLVRRSDLIVIVGNPSASTAQSLAQTLQREEFLRKPVWFLAQRTGGPDRNGPLESILPARVEQVVQSEMNIFVVVPESKRLHPIFRVPTAISDPWSSLPPVFRSQTAVRPPPDAEVLATIRMGSTVLQDPFLIVRNAEGRRTVMLTGYGIWRWKLLAPTEDAGGLLYDQFVSNVVRWLTAADDERRFRVTPDHDSFSSLEAPSFTGQVYDESLQPVDDAELRVSVTGGDATTSIVLSPLGNGQYAGASTLLPPGDYTYVAVARSASVMLGEDRGTFSVGGLNAEFVETKMNRMSLEGLSSRTGGTYFDATDVRGLADRVRGVAGFQRVELVQRTDVDLWSNPWMLGLVVLLFSTEWFLRKRAGML